MHLKIGNICNNNCTTCFHLEEKAAEKMAEKEFSITIDLHQGPHRDQVYTCDLTHEYVSINADYRT